MSAVPTRREVPCSDLDRWSVLIVGCACLRGFLADGGRRRGLRNLKGTRTANSAGEFSKERVLHGAVRVKLKLVWPTAPLNGLATLACEAVVALDSGAGTLGPHAAFWQRFGHNRSSTSA